MATGGAPFDSTDEQELANWTLGNGSLDDRLNNMDWDVPQKKANRSSEKNKKKFGAVVESRLTNDISPESTPGAGRRRARTPHSFPRSQYSAQMSVPEQAELDRLKQRINFTDLDERSIGSDSQGRATAANNQRQLSENKKAFNFLPLHVNTNKSRELAASACGGEVAKRQSAGRDILTGVPGKDALHAEWSSLLEDGTGEPGIDSSQVVSRLVQIREYIAMACCMPDDLVEKNDIPANVEHLAHLIDHLKEQEKSCLKFLQKLLARENEEDDIRTIDSAVGSGSVAESTSLNIEVHSEASDATEASHAVRPRPRIEDSLGRSVSPEVGSLYDLTAAAAPTGGGAWPDRIVSQRLGKGRDLHGEAKEELENLRKQHELLKHMLLQQEQLRALQGRQAALLAMQQKAEQAIAVMDESVVTETTGSVSGISITSELNDELNDLIQRFHNQLHDSQTKAVPDNRRQAQSLSLTREVARSRGPPGADPASLPCAEMAQLQELQDKKQTMDKILQELHTLRDHTLNNNSCRLTQAPSQRSSSGPVLSRGANGRGVTRLDPPASQHSPETDCHPAQKLRKLKEVHKRLNELRELVHYYEQTSDMMVDTVNENVKDEDTEEDSIFEPMFDSEQENMEPITNLRNPQRPGNWMDMNSLTGAHGNGNQDGRLNTEREINNRSAANLRSLNIPSAIECQYNLDRSRGEEGGEMEERPRGRAGAAGGGGSSGDSRRSSREEDPEFLQKVHRLRSAKEKLRHLQQLVAMVQSDDTDDATANASSVADDDGPNQQPNNRRAAGPKPQKDLTLTEKEREKFYEAKLKQQQQELRQLHDERQHLINIKGEIQDLRWACPDLQPPAAVSHGPAPTGHAPAAASTPAVNASGAALNRTVEPTATAAPDNKLWAEMHRHQILREHLRQRRKHLESLMEEHQRRKVLNDSPHAGQGTPQAPEHPGRDERTMAAWGGASPGVHDEYEDDVLLEVGPELEEEEEADTSSSEDFPSYSSRKRRSHSSRKSRDRSLQTSDPRSASGSARPSPRSRQEEQEEQQQEERSMSRRRQENPRWASELSFLEEKRHWQEQISQLQKQLDFSTSMCQTLMQDQQALSYMLPSLMSASYSMLPNSVGSPPVHLVMHQLNQCYAQLAWQQSNVQRLKQVLTDLQKQQQSQPMEQSPTQDPSPTFPPLHLPPPLNALNLPGLGNYSYLPPGFGYSPVFPPGMGEFYQNPGAQDNSSPPQGDANGESVCFPQPFESSMGSGDKRNRMKSEGGSNPVTPGPADPSEQPRRGGARQQPPRVPGARQTGGALMGSLSSVPDPSDPTTVTKSFRSKKASAQALLASRDKTPKAQTRRRRGKTHGRKAGLESDSVSSVSDYHGKDKAVQSQGRESERPEKILEKLTQEKRSSKPQVKTSNDLSSAYAWRTPFLSNRIACTEVQDTSSDFSLFEALRETIYSEVATLISQNESRPHFLIELFHELQLLNTDYLRQRALFALQDIVSRHLTEKDVGEEPTASLSSAAWAASNSELTPSESVATSDADVSEKNMAKALHVSKNHNDDGVSLDDESILSTSSNLDPFASDDLGNTVIHLDKAMARMREYERMKLSDAASASSTIPTADPRAPAPLPGPPEGQDILGQMFSGVRCPQIDTQQLDRQIKAIMSEVLPFLQEHMEDVCSTQLLTTIRRMVMQLTQQNDESKEFVRFFHKQLGGILQESLSKFCGRTLKECGEDLLVAISETLFNELAFFRLMQDFDCGTAAPPKRKFGKREGAMMARRSAPMTRENKSPEDQSFAEGFHDEDKTEICVVLQDKDDTEKGNVTIEPETKESRSSDASEREEEEEDDDDSEGLPLSIRLSKAETQPLTNYGSGEDENEDEELEEFQAGPADVQTSLQASSDLASHQEQKTNEIQEDGRHKGKFAEGATECCEVSSARSDSAEGQEQSRPTAAARPENHPPCPGPSQSQPLSPEATPTCSPDTDSPVMINEDEVGSGNLSQKSDEDDFVKVEDLPLRLAVLSEERLKMTAEEQQQPNNVSPDKPGGIVGDCQTVKEAETAGAQSA
ncbi:pericentriolar material 1 protein-like isoform X3 [Conger conger]|uniref:pericentriolar material 1 protein-like isoform X3 n=1 Tax=Conger conger TaxID=82655 RepID=UPI002A59E1C9|nr:pericentriolar material 1 protein-like isoform X3 [Conger conger]